jgi:menaquinone-dependent protoporphyrinogen oxidase
VSSRVLVAYATRHGATREIAERISFVLRRSGVEVTCRDVDRVGDVNRYDAFVVGSAVYVFSWLREALEFVRRHEPILASRPTWLFSSGPLGMDGGDEQDPRLSPGPREVGQIRAALNARDHRVFYGAYDPDAPPIGLLEKATRLMPTASHAFPAGDWRDWHEIDGWAGSIAAVLEDIAADRQVARPASTSAAFEG